MVASFRFRSLVLLLAAGGLLSSGPAAALGQETDNAARAARLAAMRGRAGELVVQIGSANAAQRLQPNAEASLRFNDATREFHDGTLWAFRDRGRPCLLVSIERYEKLWSYELISLTDRPLTVEAGDWTWQPRDSPARFQPVAKADAPAKTADGRGRQARALARRFAAIEFLGDDQERTELRLLTRPILIYESPDYGIATGALFVLSNGTNPEVLLTLEATSVGGASHWQYAFAPISTAALEASLDGERVWQVARSQTPRSQTAYSHFGIEAEPISEEKP